MFKPDKYFFNSDHKSKELRDLCVEVMAYITSYSEDPTLPLRPMDKEILLNKIYLVLNHLKELGIYPNIRSGLSLEEYVNSPLNCSQWLAGGILKTIEQIGKIPHIGEIRTDYEEHNPEMPLILSAEEMESNSINFMVLRSQLDMIRQMFSITQEELDQYSEN